MTDHDVPNRYRLWLKQEIGLTDYCVGDVFRVAFRHGRDLVADTDADADVTLSSEELAEAEQALDSSDDYVLLTEPVLHNIALVVGLGAHYMWNNDYSDDEDFPDDAFAARILGDRAESYFYSATELPRGWRFAAAEREPTEMRVWSAGYWYAQAQAEKVGVDEIVFRQGSRVIRHRKQVDVPQRWGGTRKEWKDVPV